MKKIGFVAVVALAAWTGAAARTMYSVQPVADVVLWFERVNMPWGYMDGDGHQHYYIADYQGNIRVGGNSLRF
ncbi:MAG: hypothetical protein K2M68_01690 [Muribaculaceae bacterium]|nr:hypothetical protein [Muribaculaceae bacterium]